jgi:hypothetical protein
MATFTVSFVCDNAAFEDNGSDEIARILQRIARDVRNMGTYEDYGICGDHIRDINGNKIGQWEFDKTRGNDND